MAVFPSIAKFADVLQQVKGQDPVEAVRVATSLSHLWGVYKGKPLQSMLDNVLKIALTQPEGLSSVLTQARYFSSAVQLGVPMKDIFSTIALMGQTGFLRGKGGTGFQNLLLGAVQASAPTAHLSKRQAAARSELQLRPDQFAFFDQNRQFRFQPLLDHIAAMRKTLDKQTGSPAEFVKDIADLFGKQAAPFIAAVTSDTARSQSANIKTAMDRAPGVDAAWKVVSGNFAFQWQSLMTNLSNLSKSIFTPTLDVLTPKVKAFAEEVAKLTNWFEKHPKAGLDVAYGAFVAVMLGAVSTAENVWLLNAAVRALGRSAGFAAPSVASSAAGEDAVAGAAARTIGPLSLLSSVLLAIAGLALEYQVILDYVKNRIKADPKNAGGIRTGQTQRGGHLQGEPSRVIDYTNGVLGTSFGGIATGGTTANALRLPANARGEQGGTLSRGAGVPGAPSRPGVVQLPGRMPSSSQLPAVLRGYATGGRTADTGWGLLHPNEVIVKDSTVVAMDKFFSRGGGQQPIVIAPVINYNAPPNEDDVTHRRRATMLKRNIAGEIAMRLTASLRTTGSGLGIDPAGTSQYEIIGGVA